MARRGTTLWSCGPRLVALVPGRRRVNRLTRLNDRLSECPSADLRGS